MTMAVGSSSSSAERFSELMSSMPGFRFHPTDEELVMYYVKRKMCRKRLKLDVIREIDVYKRDPEELPALSILKTGDRQWFFFSPRDRKYPNGARTNRATSRGYWKLTGKDRNVTCNSRAVGVKKTLVFYRGKAPNGKRTNWVMHEYTLDEEELRRCQGVQDYYALYKVFKKSGPGPKNGEQYGAPFREEEWTDDVFVDFNINSDHQLLNEVSPVDPVTDNGLVQPLFDDEIQEIMQRFLDVDPALDLHVNGYPALTEVAAEETQSSVLDQFSQAVTFSEPSRMFLSNGQPCDVQPSFDLTQSACHLHVSEAPEVASAPNIQREGLDLCVDDYLEINDLSSPEPTSLNVEAPVENLQYENGLSLSDLDDLYHDAEMFLCDIGPIDQGTLSHPYFDSNIVNQNFQLLPDQEDANQTGGQSWMHDQRNILSRAEDRGSFSIPTPGVVCESASFPTEGNENQSGTVGGIATSSFSSALWAFVESIPTNPASAAENSLVNRTFERMSSFSRMRINIKQSNVAVGNGTATMKRTGRKGVLFLFVPILVALFGFLWVSVGTLKLFGISIF